MVGPRNRVLGQELSGVIEATGATATGFSKGDQVFATTTIRLGAHAEYICLATSGAITTKPFNMTYAEAATVPTGGLNALHFLRKGDIQPGETVLINGAGGTIGTMAVQIAKHLGAKVTAVDSAEKLAMLTAIGADRVIDYQEEGFTEGGQIYDVIFDVAGTSSFSRSMRSLNQNGRYVLANPKLLPVIRGLWSAVTSRKRVISGLAGGTSADLAFLKQLVEAGAIRATVDRCYPLEDIADAHHYVETGRKKGSVVITIADDNTHERTASA